jgi:hypothetical protein
LWSAAEFFLNFVWVRMRQAKTHWHQVVNMVGCNTYLYEQVSNPHLTQIPFLHPEHKNDKLAFMPLHALQMVNEQNSTQEYRSRLALLKSYRGDNNYTPPTAELRDFRDGIKSWARLSNKLSRQLSTIAATNDKFLNSTADHFKGLAKYLSSIRGIIDDLEADSRKLADQASEWESLLHNVSSVDPTIILRACLPLGYRSTNSFVPA